MKKRKDIQSMHKKLLPRKKCRFITDRRKRQKTIYLYKTFSYVNVCSYFRSCRKTVFCWHAFSTEKILKLHIKDCFKINGKQRIIMSEKYEYVKFKNMKEKQSHHLWFMQFSKLCYYRKNIKNILLSVMAIN